MWVSDFEKREGGCNRRRQIEEDGYKYLGILETDKIEESKMKVKFGKEYTRRLKLVLKSKLNGKNKIVAINTWAIAVLRYGAGLVNWNKDEVKKLDRKTRKIMTMYGALHPKSDVDRIYIPRAKEGRGLISCENCIRRKENNLGWYVKNSGQKLLEGVKLIGVIDIDYCVDKGKYRKRRMEVMEKGWKEKVMHSQFLGEMGDGVDKRETWRWLRKTNLKVETEALICAAQKQPLRTNYVKFNIDKNGESPLCRMCGKKGESMSHIICECSMLAQKKYKRRHAFPYDLPEMCNVCCGLSWRDAGRP